MSIEIDCPSCSRRLSLPEAAMGKKIRCPACKNVVDTSAAKPAEASAAPPPAPAPPPKPAAAPASDKLPPTMLATKQLAGRSCPACGRVLALGEPVRNCEKCSQSFHEPCWIQNGGCTVRGCGLPNEEIPDDRATQPCPRCGGTIPAEARKWPLCREWIERGGPAPLPQGGYAPPPSPGGYAPPPAYYPPMQESPSGLAITALVTGILGLLLSWMSCFCPPIGLALGLPALITGIMGLRQVDREPHHTGRGMAIAGIVLGSLTLLMFLAGVAFFVLAQAGSY